MAPEMLVTLALDRFYGYALALAGIHPEVLATQRTETPGAGRGELAFPPVLMNLT